MPQIDAHDKAHPFPKDCRACAGAQHLLDAFSRFTKHKEAAPQNDQNLRDGAASQAAPGGASGSMARGSGQLPCPPDTSQLGKAAWTFLHSTAAYYPEQPSTAQQSLMRSMMDGLAEFYPCQVCAEHLREQFKASPPEVASAKDLNMWLCKIHNEVNEMLGKPAFDCSRVFERWRDGADDCSGDE